MLFSIAVLIYLASGIGSIMSNSTTQDKNCFQFKADFLPLTVFKINELNLEAIAVQLSKTLESAPKYFQHAPILIDVEQLARIQSPAELEKLCELLREHQMLPVGIRGLDESHHHTALHQNLAIISPAKEKKPAASQKEPSAQPMRTHTKIIHTPIRAGTRVYAKDADLIILNAVNPGAECIADGNIHIYGPLRGRALAGASGDTNARIFCETLEAELISIAGHYLVNENIKPLPSDKPMVQIYLTGESIHIEGV